ASPFVSGDAKTYGYAQSFFPWLGTFLRNKFYLPCFVQPIESFFQHCDTHAKNITRMLKGECSDCDPTFPHLPELKNHYVVKDIPITVTHNNHSIASTVRVIETKPEFQGNPLRLILFSFNDNRQTFGDAIGPWNPKTADEVSILPIEILRALQTHTSIDSLMCFSLGGITLNGLKHITPEDSAFIPKTVILNRSLRSTWKVASVLFPWMKWPLHFLTYLYGLDANPEQEILSFYQRLHTQSPDSMKERTVVEFSATRDRYFSAPGDYDETFHQTLKDTQTTVHHGKFFIPLVAEIAHHAMRADHLLNNPDSETDTTHFFTMSPNESVPQTLVREIFNRGKTHTSLFVGGNRDSLDSLTYLHALPVLEAHYTSSIKK
ncbi:MAG: hypothetical protein KDK71_10065, partial [Chlamydiia bacterium]|nr:hypothetical protein [Chlamydiia bacterium]